MEFCMNNSSFIQTDDQLEFAIFCIENIAHFLHIDTIQLYNKLYESDILNHYIVANYNILHTQDKNYIINDIINIMPEKGVSI